jgi:hypothetical protein
MIHSLLDEAAGSDINSVDDRAAHARGGLLRYLLGFSQSIGDANLSDRSRSCEEEPSIFGEIYRSII